MVVCFIPLIPDIFPQISIDVDFYDPFENPFWLSSLATHLFSLNVLSAVVKNLLVLLNSMNLDLLSKNGEFLIFQCRLWGRLFPPQKLKCPGLNLSTSFVISFLSFRSVFLNHFQLFSFLGYFDIFLFSLLTSLCGPLASCGSYLSNKTIGFQLLVHRLLLVWNYKKVRYTLPHSFPCKPYSV